MALAYGNFHELSHQLRFLLFEIGIGLPQTSIDYFITLAHRNTLKRLQSSALAEGLINSPISSHHAHDFIDQLQMKLKYSEPSSQFFQWKNIRDELDESIANEALAQIYKQRWNSQIRHEANQYDSLWSWINNELTAGQALLFLEQWGCEGHPSHPTFRAKMGFTRREVLQNSAEFQARISLHWCSLHKNQTTLAAKSDDFNKLMAQEFPTEFKLWQEKLICNHINPQEYHPVPVHSWQWRNKLQMMYTQMIDSKLLILLPHHQTVMPSMSDDTMMPVDDSNCHIKLAIDIHTPYSSKTDQSEFIQYGVAISHWVSSLLARSGHYKNTLFLANELTGLSVNNDSTLQYCQKELSVRLLQNPASLVKSDQKAIPLASLFTNSPLSNKPLLIEIIKASGLTPLDYFSRYCHKILFGQLHLLLKDGVAFETQHHNILIIFADNLPQGLIIRNLEEINIDYSMLYQNNERPNLLSDSRIKSCNLDKLRTAFIHGTLQNNLNHWINCLKNEYQLNEHQLWNIVHQVLHTVLNELPKDIHPRILCWQKHQLLSDAWQHQCLLTMRLKGNINKDIYIKQPNPLHHDP